MKLFFSISFLISILSSCTIVNIPRTNQKFSDLNIHHEIKFTPDKKFDTIVSKAMENAIEKFNSDKKNTYKVHKKSESDSSFLQFNFSNGKFVSEGTRALGYASFLVGLIVTPYATYIASDQELVVAFLFLPKDRINISVDMYPLVSNKNLSSKRGRILSGALFRNKEKRTKSMIKQVETNILIVLYKINTRNLINIKRNK